MPESVPSSTCVRVHQPQSHLQALAMPRWELLGPRGWLSTGAMHTQCLRAVFWHLSSPPGGYRMLWMHVNISMLVRGSARGSLPTDSLALVKPTPEGGMGTVGALMQPHQQVQINPPFFGQISSKEKSTDVAGPGKPGRVSGPWCEAKVLGTPSVHPPSQGSVLGFISPTRSTRLQKVARLQEGPGSIPRAGSPIKTGGKSYRVG